ncbi:hypothetical protein AWB76_07664 [Caballeronia temeraria]|uniref:Uncharacterized protein n=1 Tax=Caballeronia temeraria TaxID=1777137 RepID=A0A158DX37_9BURK|nr:hypothetical protein AWB76_07664 [Caballeronia temeraria]
MGLSLSRSHGSVGSGVKLGWSKPRAQEGVGDECSAQLLIGPRRSVIHSFPWPADEEAVIVSGCEVVPNLGFNPFWRADHRNGHLRLPSILVKRDRRRSDSLSQLPVEHGPGTLAFRTNRATSWQTDPRPLPWYAQLATPYSAREYQDAIGAPDAM